MEEVLPKIMLVDMNSFFASVEQQADPFLRGKPVGVCASLHETSCLIAASKEAKALGIKTGTLVYKAKKIYPKIILRQAEPEKYREVNRQINRIFLDYTDTLEAYSIDESFLDLRNSKLNPLIVGSEIKQRIKDEVGEWLTCSIGIAPNKFLAKLAADLEKPDGLSIVWRDNLPEIYKHKQLTDLWGIAYGWQKRLAKLGITSPLQLLNYPVQNLMAVFGKPGFYLWQRVNGLEIDELRITNYGLNDPKSFGNSWVLNFWTIDKEKLKIVILRLAEKASRRLRQEGMVASGMYLSITLSDGSHLGTSKKLKHLINTGWELYEQALIIWKDWEFKSEVMHIAVGFTHLAPKVNQLQLFKLNYELTNYGLNSQFAIRNFQGVCQESLQNCLDRINDKYGEFTIRSGLLTRTSDFAPACQRLKPQAMAGRPDAIAFGR